MNLFTKDILSQMVFDFNWFKPKKAPLPQKFEVYQSLERWLAGKGFKLNMGMHQFIKRTKLGFHAIYVSVSTYKDELLVDVNFGNRLDLVENTAYQFTTGLQGFSPYATTTIIHPTAVDQEFRRRFSIKTDADLKQFETEVRLFFNAYGFEYFSFLDDKVFLDVQYNAKPLAPSLVQYNEVNRAFRGITIAQLAGNCSFDQLMNTYHQKLHTLGAGSQVIDKYILLANYLKFNSFN